MLTSDITKFRGKRTDTNEWIYGNFMTSFENSIGTWIIEKLNHVIELSGDWYFSEKDIVEVKDYSVCMMLYRNPYDWSEYYEGDIIKTGKKIGYIYWDEDKLSYLLIQNINNELVKSDLSLSDVLKCEVLGNIFDNPEIMGCICIPNKIGEKVGEV